MTNEVKRAIHRENQLHCLPTVTHKFKIHLLTKTIIFKNEKKTAAKRQRKEGGKRLKNDKAVLEWGWLGRFQVQHNIVF